MFNKIIFEKLLSKLDSLIYGRLKITSPDGKTYIFQGRDEGVSAHFVFHDWNVISNLVMKGDVGFAEDYRDGKWEADNLQNLIMIGLNNEGAFQSYVLGSWVGRTMSRLSYLWNTNTVKQSKQNIHTHYDIGNEFYKMWLDPSMTYSAAIYEDGKEQMSSAPIANDNAGLKEAQYNKYDRIVDVMGRNSGSILEVGCGWGGFAERASERGDFGIKGVTISEEQHAYAQKRLGEKADIVLEDYRHQSGKYDNIVSIEMFEAVGERYWPTYFNKIGSLLKKDGKAVIQTITIREQDFENYRRGGDFIRSFIFPGGMLPSPSRLNDEVKRAGLKVNDNFAFGQHYAKTLEQWLANFDEVKSDVLNKGFDVPFIRLWRFYLAACAAGFRSGRTDVVQIEVAHAA